MTASAAAHEAYLDAEQAKGDLAEAEVIERQWRDLDELAQLGLPLFPPPSPEDEPVAHDEWRQVPGTPYEASSLGHVRRDGLVLAQRLNGGGYPVVTLFLDGRSVPREVSRLVALAFLGAPSPGEQARHLDDVKTHNHVENLAWGTPRENALDAIANHGHHHADRPRCVNGHALVEPNLRGGARRAAGQRECWTCDHARKRVAYHASRGRVLDLAVVMDQSYARVREQCERAT